MQEKTKQTDGAKRCHSAWLGAWALATSLCGPAWAGDPSLQVDAYQQPLHIAAEMVVQSQALRPVPTASLVDLGTWHAAQHQSAQATFDGAYQVGSARLSLRTQNYAGLGQQLQWHSTEHGGLRAAVTFRSGGAHALRLGVLVDKLPGSAMLRIYHPDRPHDQFAIAGQRILQLLQLNHDAGDTSEAGRTWWTPESMDDSVTLEIELPPGTNASHLRISVPQVMHIYEDILRLHHEDGDFTTQIGESDSCNQDATCYSEYAAASNAVARISFVKDGGSYLCTGTLINDRASSGTPYFLTANHCLNTQTSASSLQTRWFYRSSSCNAPTLSSSARNLYNGATLLYATANQDSTLLRLNEAPPAGATFAGWDANVMQLGETGVGIHHPRGDMAKVSWGRLNYYFDCGTSTSASFSCTGRQSDSGHYYNIRWSAGTTEGGSSGSALFKNGRLTGVLYGGNGSCSLNDKNSVYGRFDKLYPAIRQWLDAAAARPAVARQPVFRFFNHATGTHFYTNSASERDQIIATLPTYQYEGTAFYAAAQSGEDLDPVTRFYNSQSGSHFYTINAAERDNVRANLPHYRYEGPMWYANPNSASGNRPIYRFYNANTGTHFYTATEVERDVVMRDLPAYRYEGVAYYVWATP